MSQVTLPSMDNLTKGLGGGGGGGGGVGGEEHKHYQEY